MTKCRLAYLPDGDVGCETREGPVHVALEVSARVDPNRVVELDAYTLLVLTAFYFSHVRGDLQIFARLKIAIFTKIVVLTPRTIFQKRLFGFFKITLDSCPLQIVGHIGLVRYVTEHLPTLLETV